MMRNEGSFDRNMMVSSFCWLHMLLRVVACDRPCTEPLCLALRTARSVLVRLLYGDRSVGASASFSKRTGGSKAILPTVVFAESAFEKPSQDQ
jgi:hypothetical protein